MGLDNPLHIAFLLVILLLVFGAKRLPEMGRSLGDGLRGFKDSMSGESSSHSIVPHEHMAPAPAPAQPQAIVAAPTTVRVAEDSTVSAAARTLGSQRGEVVREGELAAH